MSFGSQTAKDIGVGRGGDDSVWIITDSPIEGGFAIMRYSSSSASFDKVDGGAVTITVLPS